jgi:hypothetical protein
MGLEAMGLEAMGLEAMGCGVLTIAVFDGVLCSAV